MANYASIKAEIVDAIYANNAAEITGPVLQQVLLDLVANLTVGYQYAGVAAPTTDPGTVDQKVFYLAPAGSYIHFGASEGAPYVVPDGCFGIFRFDTTWRREYIRIAPPAPVTYATCDTAGATAAKVVAADNFQLAAGAQIRITMAHANTAASPTLNVNGTGAKALYYDGAAAGASNTWEDGETILAYYDGTRWQATNAQNGSGAFATGELVKETEISDEVEAGSEALVTGDAVVKHTADLAGIDGTVESTIDNTAIRNYIVGNRWINNAGGIQAWNSTDTLLMPVTAGDIMAIHGLMIPPKTVLALWLYKGNPNGGGGVPVASVDTSYLRPGESVVFQVPEGADYVGITVNGRSIQNTDGETVSFDSTETIFAQVYGEIDLTAWGSRVVPVTKLIVIDGLSGERTPIVNAKLAPYILGNKGVNTSGAVVNWNKADLLVMPVDEGSIAFHGFQTQVALNVWMYDENPMAGGVLVQTIENYPFPSVSEALFDIPSGVKYIAIYTAYRDVDGVSFNTNTTINADAMYAQTKLRDAFGNQIKDFVTLRATKDYVLANGDMSKYIYPGKAIAASGAITNWVKDTLLVFPVIPGETVVFDGLNNIDLPPVGPSLACYASDPLRGTVYPVTFEVHSWVPGEPLVMNVPAGIYYIAFLVGTTEYTYGGQTYAFDSTGTIFATVTDGPVRRTIWGTPTGKEIEKRLTDLGGGGGGGAAISQAIDMGLPRDLPKVYIESELLTVVKDGQGNPTNQILPLTTAKNEVGDLDEGDVTIRMESASGDYDFTDSIVIAYQGQSSLGADKKNFSIDCKKKHRFGKWLAMDGFHLKGYNSDWLHIRDIMANRIYEQMCQTHTPDRRRPFCVANDFSAHDVALLTESAVLCHIDGFPVELYINGDYWGLYSLNLKKHRSNYHLDKSNVAHIQIDPNWQVVTPSGWDWRLAEVRNPKSDSGNTEFIEGTVPNPGEVRTWMETTLSRLAAITTATTVDSLRTWMNVESWVDILVFYEFIGDWDIIVRNTLYTTWDGNHFAVVPYDHDGSFGIGRSWRGGEGYVGGDVEVPSSINIFADYVDQRAPWLPALRQVLTPLMRERYAELRMAGVFSKANVKAMCNAWTMQIGFDGYKKDLDRWTYEGYGAGQTNPGFYDSTNRIIEWIGGRVGYLDNKFGYNE